MTTITCNVSDDTVLHTKWKLLNCVKCWPQQQSFLFFKPGKNLRGRARQTIFLQTIFEILKLPIYCPQPSSICPKIYTYIWLMGGGHGLKHLEQQLRQKFPLLLEGPPQAEFLTWGWHWGDFIAIQLMELLGCYIREGPDSKSISLYIMWGPGTTNSKSPKHYYLVSNGSFFFMKILHLGDFFFKTA